MHWEPDGEATVCKIVELGSIPSQCSKLGRAIRWLATDAVLKTVSPLRGVWVRSPPLPPYTRQTGENDKVCYVGKNAN